MTKTRIEGFSDGVLAIVITIMVLEIKIPHEATFHALAELVPVFISYLLSFVFVGIYWGNHHHLMHTAQHVNSKIIWANMALLFSLSLIPFTTGWMGENLFDKLPVALYGFNLLMCAVTYFILHQTILKAFNHQSELINALEKQGKKGFFSLIGYVLSIPIAFIFPIVSAIIFVTIAVIWVIPDKNIEKALKSLGEKK